MAFVKFSKILENFSENLKIFVRNHERAFFLILSASVVGIILYIIAALASILGIRDHPRYFTNLYKMW